MKWDNVEMGGRLLSFQDYSCATPWSRPVTARAPAKAPGDSHRISGALERGWALQDAEKRGKDTECGRQVRFPALNYLRMETATSQCGSKSLQVEWKEEGGVVGIGGPNSRRPHLRFQGRQKRPPQVSTCGQGLAGGFYFRVYGKRLEPAPSAADDTPHPLRKWGGEQQGCG